MFGIGAGAGGGGGFKVRWTHVSCPPPPASYGSDIGSEQGGADGWGSGCSNGRGFQSVRSLVMCGHVITVHSLHPGSPDQLPRWGWVGLGAIWRSRRLGTSKDPVSHRWQWDQRCTICSGAD